MGGVLVSFYDAIGFILLIGVLFFPVVWLMFYMVWNLIRWKSWYPQKIAQEKRQWLVTEVTEVPREEKRVRVREVPPRAA